MQEKQTGRDSVFVTAGRSLGGSRVGQLFVALVVASLFSGLAFIAWHARDLAATVLSIGLLLYGFSLTWRLLPFSRATRARWVEEQQKAEKCPACQFRGALGAGSGLLLVKLWPDESAEPFTFLDFLVPGFFLVIGTISYVLCRRFIRRARAADAMCASDDDRR